MVNRYHEFRRSVLLARQAYVREAGPAQLADCILAAARELLMLAGDIPLERLQHKNREDLLARLKSPELREPVRLLVQSQELADQVIWLENEEGRMFWRQQAYRLLWKLDCIMVELAASFRDRAPEWLGRMTPIPPAPPSGMH